MTIQLILGSAVICMTLIVETAFIAIASLILTRLGSKLTKGNQLIKLIFSLLAVVLWILTAISIGVWIWAGVFLALDQFSSFEEALYFAAVSITTLGYGDLTLEKDWRILSGLIAANGLILFSLATAFFFEFLRQLRTAQTRNGTG